MQKVLCLSALCVGPPPNKLALQLLSIKSSVLSNIRVTPYFAENGPENGGTCKQEYHHRYYGYTTCPLPPWNSGAGRLWRPGLTVVAGISCL